MINSGTFVLSLDCEGKWGVADHLTGKSSLINSSSLSDAYSFINNELNDKRIKSTMAFTSLFTVSEKVIKSHADSIREMSALGHSWYDPIIAMIDNEDFDGWIGNSYFNDVLKYGHDIAWHGFTHHILSDDVNDEVAKYEIESGIAISKDHGIDVKSIIFPRNVIGKKEILSSYGFNYYRGYQHQKSIISGNRFLRVIDEFNILKKSQDNTYINDSSGMVELPSGYFLNWPSGYRNIVPRVFTVKRWQSMLDDAAKNNKQVHMWFHPHNLITAPRMRETFTKLLDMVSSYVKSGAIQVKTMSEIYDEYGVNK